MNEPTVAVLRKQFFSASKGNWPVDQIKVHVVSP